MIAYTLFSPARNGYYAGFKYVANGMSNPRFEANPLDASFFEEKDDATRMLNHPKLVMCRLAAFSINEVAL